MSIEGVYLLPSGPLCGGTLYEPEELFQALTIQGIHLNPLLIHSITFSKVPKIDNTASKKGIIWPRVRFI